METTKGFNIKVFDFVPEHLIDQVDQLLESIESNNRITADSTLREYSKEHFTNKIDRAKYIVALDGETVVGIVLVFKRELIFNDKKIMLGGLGGVGTKKEYRGRGIATSMLKESKKILKELECDVAYLGTDLNNPALLKMYGKIGFAKLGKSHTYIGKSGKTYLDDDGMIAPVNSQEIFNEILIDDKPFDLGGSNW